MLLVRFAFLLLLLVSSACQQTMPAPAQEPGAYQKRTIAYKSLSGTAQNLLSLDVYRFTTPGGPRPVVLYVHGGGWVTGDKANQLAHKLALFQSLGCRVLKGVDKFYLFC
ncbi:hypothetical protein [Hymenobacter sp. GOD-10R]|uniref:alpha/beta hydrolase n=1 Tax=Hymenobacter sp. GOD-10R TaxID=3093922 RepID=UPI002D76C028|nr:hypothetical protein [Hymenobacter sp. GOD-10R]WRQ31775.1 hypothetical protein SD425_28410 [Hymenobacter sp. GOD-10R]